MTSDERTFLAEYAYMWARGLTHWDLDTCDAFSEWYADQENGMYSLEAAARDYTDLLNVDLDS